MYLTSNDIKEFFYEIETLLTKIFDVYYAIDYANNPKSPDNSAALKDDFIPLHRIHYEQDAIIIRQESLPKYFEKIESLLIASGNNPAVLAKAQKLFDTTIENYIISLNSCNRCKTYIAKRDPKKPFDLAINYTIDNLDSFLIHFYNELSEYKPVKLAYAEEVLSIINNVLDIKKVLDSKPKKKELIYSFKEAIKKEADFRKVKLLIKHFKLKSDSNFSKKCSKRAALFAVLKKYLKNSYYSTRAFNLILNHEFKLKKQCSDRSLTNTYLDFKQWENSFTQFLNSEN